MRVLLALLLLPLAGCMGPDDDTTTAEEAYRASQAAADAEFDYTLFLGVTGTEGPLDWAAYEDALRAGGGQGERFAEAFDQDVPNGDFGDGRLGAWVTTHFAYDEERHLLGGLFTQVFADGHKDRLFAPFTGPYSGTTAFADTIPTLALRTGLETYRAAQEEAPVLCALVTRTDAWHVSAEEAMEAAMQTQTLRDHLAEYPDGELTYYYFPQLDVEPGCPATIDTPSNHWTIFHTDLDAQLDPSRPTPTLACIQVDADTGEVQEVAVEPLVLRAPMLVDEDLRVQDPLVYDGWQTHAVTVPVEDGATLLELQSLRRERPAGLLREETVLVAPDGRPVARHDFEEAFHQYLVEDPHPGDWRLEYRYLATVPAGEHVLTVHGAVVYT